MIARVGERRRRDHVATRNVRQVWTNVRARRRAVNRMAHDARRVKKHLLSVLLRIGCRRNGSLRLILSPRVELFLWLGDNPKRHLRVLQTTVLRALPAINAGLISLQPA